MKHLTRSLVLAAVASSAFITHNARAAGLLIAHEAGAIHSDWQGRPVELARGEVLCANPRLHSELLGVLSSVEHGVLPI